MALFDPSVVYGGLGGNLVPGTSGRDFFQRRNPGDIIYGGLGAVRSGITDASRGRRPDDIINAVLGRSELSSARGLTGKPSPDNPLPSGPSLRELTAGAVSQPQAFDYLDAPWSSAYGMSKETAYAEAMENTAYRRSVADMQKAGLNPAVIFGAGRGSTAGSPSYISSGSSGPSGRVSRRGSGGRSSGKLFSTSAYSVLSALGGIVGAAATKSAGGYWLGMSLSQGAMSALNLLSKRR